MTQYGKIIIIADSIAEAEKELATIKALANAGAVYGKGSTDNGAEIRMGNVPSAPSAPSSNYHCIDCSICPRRCREETYHWGETNDEYEEDDFYGTDDYEDDEAYNEKVEAFRMAVQKIVFGK
jgi:hypothetical protein